jgi:hypothetical protein
VGQKEDLEEGRGVSTNMSFKWKGDKVQKMADPSPTWEHEEWVCPVEEEEEMSVR